MPDLSENSGPDPAASLPLPERINLWLLSNIDRSPAAPTWSSVLVIIVLLGVIGVLDYLTGVRISLSVFYVLPVTLSVAWLGWRAGCLTGLLSVAARVGGDIAAGGYRAGALTVFWNRLIDLAMYCVLASILHALITLQRKLEQRVRERTDALAKVLREREELQRQLFNISRRERASIGHELHDSLGQHLTATSLAAKLLGNRLEGEAHPAAPDAHALVRLLQDGISQTRHIARGLLLSSIEPEQLAGELEELCSDLQRKQHIPCRFIREGEVSNLEVGQSSHLYYIAQEAARNALRHGRPTQIEIRLRGTPQLLEIVITDNGCGLPVPAAAPSGMGLRIMAHRAQLIGADFSLVPAFGGGLCVRCALPLGKSNVL